jgi:S1-C subfamily serine protease
MRNRLSEDGFQKRHSPIGPAISWAAISLLLGGCVAATQLVQNDQLAADVKAKGFARYKEILLVPPKEDPRSVVPRVVSGFSDMGYTVRVMDADKPLEPGQGTGFVISENYVLTCAHVIGDELAVTISSDNVRIIGDVVKASKDVDLALIKLRTRPSKSITPLSFRDVNRGYALGEDVFTIGFPLSHLLGNNARMTKGVLSATSGLRDDPKTIQVSAEVQPGNSGGPLLDRDGLVMGVVAQTVNPWRVAQTSGGALPQNVNFSIKSSSAIGFLQEADKEAYAALQFNKPRTLDKAAPAVVKVQAGIVEESSRTEKLIVRLSYISRWDIWFRFRRFVLTAYDFDSQEPLFAAGQGRDNMISNEDVVIRDTLAQFKKALDSE